MARRLTFRVNGMPMKNFPVSSRKLFDHALSIILLSKTQEVIALIPGEKGTIYRIKKVKELRDYIKRGYELSFNDLRLPLVGGKIEG